MFKIASIATAVAAGAAAAIALAACSPPNEQASTVSATTSSMPMSGHDMPGHSMPGMSGSSTSAAPAANFNDADVMFLQMMYPHHAQAVEMAKLVQTRSQNQQVKDLAAAIEKAQAPEMQQMTCEATSE